MTDIRTASAGTLLDLYRDGSLSPTEVVEALAASIDAADGKLGAFQALCLDRARAEARRAEVAWARW